MATKSTSFWTSLRLVVPMVFAVLAAAFGLTWKLAAANAAGVTANADGVSECRVDVGKIEVHFDYVRRDLTVIKAHLKRIEGMIRKDVEGDGEGLRRPGAVARPVGSSDVTRSAAAPSGG